MTGTLVAALAVLLAVALGAGTAWADPVGPAPHQGEVPAHYDHDDEDDDDGNDHHPEGHHDDEDGLELDDLLEELGDLVEELGDLIGDLL